MALKQRSILPGFALALGVTLAYLSLLALIPLSTIFLETAGMGWRHFWSIVTSPRVEAAYRLSFVAALVAALINAALGFLTAGALTRYRVPGAKLFDAIVDLPFALPTSVAGITLTAVFAVASLLTLLAVLALIAKRVVGRFAAPEVEGPASDEKEVAA